MADKDPNGKQNEEPADGGEPRKSRKGLFLGGGIVALIGLAYLTVMMAVPGGVTRPTLKGPFVADLTAQEVSVNLAGNGGRDYLGIMLRAEYAAYAEAYVPARTAEPLYMAMLQDRVLTLLSGKTKEEISGTVGKDVLREELREAVDPILFPVHVGDTVSAVEADEESGLRAGRSIGRATFRGLFHEHALKVDAPDRTIALDEGEKVAFEPGDGDVRLDDPGGNTLYVDVSRLKEDFVGEVPVGVKGRIRNIYFSKFISQ